ncbi:MAG: nicotinate phosphoribosyltransferase [Parcubacteria group bacterium Gr01-1014_19]|nr:MAG: nicotinate phosphoribosyltransferase [Parcubacteria group bacterium Gr01-1014_19]
MKWIINSLLDTDFYKFTMGQLVFLKHKDVPVKYAFKNRTKGVRLGLVVNEKDLRAELDHVRALSFKNSELRYLRGAIDDHNERMFCEEYLQFLADLRLPPYKLSMDANEFVLEFEGKWSEAIYWETFALSIVNELYYRKQMSELSEFEKEVVEAEGRLRLAKKIKALRERPAIKFTDFGTRRRFSREWQDYVVKMMSKEFPPLDFRGTSNVLLAMKYDLMPMGTSAHEMFMVMAGICHGSDHMIRASHNYVLEEWWDLYRRDLSIALTDTYGTDFFFADFRKDQAQKWKGFRHDSGDPIAFGEKVLAFYKRHGIPADDKMIVFSDGLDVWTMIKIYDYFNGKIKVSFGWGTNLTNDLGFPALSLVVKPVWANGHGLVKLSDNIAKAIGLPEDIESYKRIFSYGSSFSEECVY